MIKYFLLVGWVVTSLFAPFVVYSTIFSLSSVDASLGYRWGSLDWSIGGPDSKPNILSELEWKNLQIVDFFCEAEWMVCSEWAVDLSGNAGWIVYGRCFDSDYYQDDREEMFSLSESSSNNSSLFSLFASVGKPLHHHAFHLYVQPFIGYGVAYQHLRMYDGEQKFTVEGFCPLGKIPGLQSHYNATWWGPMMGARVVYPIGSITIRIEGRYHYVHFHGKGKWNLRWDIPDGFHQRARGYGSFVQLVIDYGLANRWRVGLRAFWEHWRTGHGEERLDVLVPADESIPFDYLAFSVKQPFNGVHWESAALMVNVGRSW